MRALIGRHHRTIHGIEIVVPIMKSTRRRFGSRGRIRRPARKGLLVSRGAWFSMARLVRIKQVIIGSGGSRRYSLRGARRRSLAIGIDVSNPIGTPLTSFFVRAPFVRLLFARSHANFSLVDSPVDSSIVGGIFASMLMASTATMGGIGYHMQE